MLSPGKDVIDHVLDETLRISEDLEKRNDAEFAEWKKSLDVVVGALKRHKEAKESGKTLEGEEMRPLLLIIGAGMRAPYGLGQAIGLESMGFGADTFDNVVGISAGACIASYYVAGDIEKGASMFWNKLSNKEFINMSRIHQGNVVDVSMAARDMMEDGPDRVNQDTIRNAKTGLYFGVTKQARDGEDFTEEFLDAKKIPDMMAGIEATMTIPVISDPSRKGVEIEGENYYDGAFVPLPIDDVIKKFNPTHVLVLPNIPFDRLETFEASGGETFVGLLAGLAGGLTSVAALKQIERMLTNKERMREHLERIQNIDGVHVGIAWPPDCALGSLGINRDAMQAAALRSAKQIVNDFGGSDREFDFFD
jgi:predicted patatin/cPLA2 family phospholipase